MLPLPAFVNSTSVRPSCYDDLNDAFRMTGFFFLRHVWEPRAQTPPDARGGFLNAVSRSINLQQVS
jgi:DNA repair protein RecO (recombination protein O)